MSLIGDLSGIGTIVETIGKVLERVIPDPNKRMEVELEMNKALIASQGQIYESMKDVMVADAQSESWMTRNARPATVFWSLGTISWVVISGTIDGLTGTHILQPTIQALKQVPSDLWNVVLVGIGGYILAKGGVDAVKAYKGK